MIFATFLLSIVIFVTASSESAKYFSGPKSIPFVWKVLDEPTSSRFPDLKFTITLRAKGSGANDLERALVTEVSNPKSSSKRIIYGSLL